jgi:hypothetical protein
LERATLAILTNLLNLGTIDRLIGNRVRDDEQEFQLETLRTNGLRDVKLPTPFLPPRNCDKQ